jgi:D-amino peptidase
VRVLISADIEGVAGVVDWDDTIPGRPDYGAARQLFTAEVSAAVRGVFAHDPHAEVVVADAHGYFRNLLPEELDRRARLLRGSPRPDFMLTSIADGVAAVIFVGYHGKAGTARSVLAHTMNGLVIHDVRCNGRSLGEIGLNIAYAAAHRATTVLVTGDDSAAAEAQDVAPGIRTVTVKRALGGMSADCLHPAEARERIEAAVPEALADLAGVQPLTFDGPVELEIDLVRPVMVEPFLLMPGFERAGSCGLRYQAPNYPTAFRLACLVAFFGMPREIT